MLAEEETRDIIGNLTTMNSRFLARVGKDKRFLNESRAAFSPTFRRAAAGSPRRAGGC